MRSVLRFIGIAFAVLAVFVLAVVLFEVDEEDRAENKIKRQQAALQPFYEPPSPLPAGKPGSLVRSEPLDTTVPVGGRAVRILYRTQKADGSPTVSSGMVLFPAVPAPKGGYPVVSWAHPTVGMADDCAPSRTPQPLRDTPWIKEMLQRGYVVTMTDYAGQGTPGTLQYLIGTAEANDVLNAVRAARALAPGKVSRRYVIWGHSQGGQSALFAAKLAPSYAPELDLVAVAAAAPAAQMTALIHLQANSPIAWLIGPEVFIAWPTVYPGLPIDGVASKAALEHYKALAKGCIAGEGYPTVTLKAAGLQELTGPAFKVDPTTIPAWYRATQQQTTLPVTQVPVLIAQGLADKVVLPPTTALLSTNFCRAGSDTSVVWMGNIPHRTAAITAGPFVASWFFDRFAGKPAGNTCDQPPAVAPAVTPPAPR